MARQDQLTLSSTIDGEDVIDYILLKYAQKCWENVELTCGENDQLIVYLDVGYLIEYNLWGKYTRDYTTTCGRRERQNLYAPFYALGWDIELERPDIYL